MIFSGSYRHLDVQFLLKPIQVEPIRDVQEKERLIQSGARHYSEMLSPESLPSSRYLALFQAAYVANRERMARDCLVLAALIARRRPEGITLVSLARAGTPVGVILKHLLERVFGRLASHYSISIIRDRGVDETALAHILKKGHTPESLVFVDGWTGKGVISRELEKAVTSFNQSHGVKVDGGLHVLSDLAGSAACAASSEDYLIPSSILNATVSGLISRSVLNESIAPGDFHGCVYYSEFAAHDRSRAFVDGIVAAGVEQAKRHGLPEAEPVDVARVATESRDFMADAMARHGIRDANLIKPGIGEATRVLLRRAPRRLILRDRDSPDVAHLVVLAGEKNVPISVVPALPYQAVSLIRSGQDG